MSDGASVEGEIDAWATWKYWSSDRAARAGTLLSIREPAMSAAKCRSNQLPHYDVTERGPVIELEKAKGSLETRANGWRKFARPIKGPGK